MTKYKLTWRTEQGGRWRKRYRGKAYYFPRQAGETKEASYARCWMLWTEKKAEIDKEGQTGEPWHRALTILIERTKARLAVLQSDDTPTNRSQWSLWAGQLFNYEWMLANGVDPLGPDGGDYENPADFFGGIPHSELGLEKVAPPWEIVAQISVPAAESIGENIERFLRRKMAQANRGERSNGRVEVLRVGLAAFKEHVGENRPMEAVTSSALSKFRDALEAQIEAGQLRPHSARDKLQAAKQFVRWAWEEELISLPRILQSREFVISLPEQKIETFTDEEVRRLLAASTEATRLYLLLMLNCGMTQVDIADLRADEVDWQAGRITRKRSKTRKNDNVPCVEYPLWPETFALLKTHRSKHPVLALTNRKGEPLKMETFVNGRAKKSDNIHSSYDRVLRKLADAKTDPVKIEKPMKLLRKTAASKLGTHPEYRPFAQHFLGHAPQTVADKHYVSPSLAQFDAAVAWLGTQFAVQN